jgi:hypothetical protein
LPWTKRYFPGLRRGPAVLLEERLRVPDAVHGHHVVERDELVLERAGGLDAGVDDVGDLLAFVGVGLEEVVELLQLVEDAQEADLVLTGVVDEVRRVAADEARLKLGGDVDDRLDLDLEALDLAAEHLVGVVDVVGAVAAVEDGRLDRGVRGDTERIRGALLALRAAVAVAVLAGGRAARYRERAHRRGGDGPAQERPPVKRAGTNGHLCILTDRWALYGCAACAPAVAGPVLRRPPGGRCRRRLGAAVRPR